MPSTRVGDVTLDIDHYVARAVIDRPAAKNALSPDVVAGLHAAIESTISARCSVLVLRGTGGTLSSGADLKYLQEIQDDDEALRDYITSIGRVVDALEAAPFVSICVVDGYAVAGGLEILLACDLAVAADDAQLGDRHLAYGLLPGAGASVRLTRAVAPVLARRLLYTGEIITGSEAGRLGLISHAVSAGRVDETVEDLVARLARHSPTALAGMKRLHRQALVLDAPTAILQEREALLTHMAYDPAPTEGLAAFAEGRSPDFSSAPSVPDDRRRVQPNAIDDERPVSGRWFEQLPVGTKVRHAIRRTVTETDNVLFTTMTMNPAPLHLDADYASRTEFKKPIINSMFTVALVVGLSVPELTLGTILAQLGLSDADFPLPLFAGDTIHVESEVVTARSSSSRPQAGIVVFEHRAYNQRRELVCRVRRTALMHRQPAKAAAPDHPGPVQ
jgi:enoyl-CoA hydratase/carnithine racemase/acyl dehydratase